MACKVAGKFTSSNVNISLIGLIVWFQFMAENRQCKHILLGCTYQQPYTDVLARYANDPIASGCITLIASGDSGVLKPFQKSFKMINLPSLFAYDLAQQAARSITEEEIGLSNWAHHATDIPGQAAEHCPWFANHDRTKGWEPTRSQILLNIDNHRVDKPLAASDPQTQAAMTVRAGNNKFCYWHYLRGECHDESCRYRHGPPLNQEELRVLTIWARSLRCEKLGQCRDSLCFYGHICPNIPNCERGKACPFKQTHDEDASIVNVYRPR